jgi:hypothetical protein
MRKICVKKEIRLTLAKEFDVSEKYVRLALSFQRNGIIPRKIRIRAANYFKAFII